MYLRGTIPRCTPLKALTLRVQVPNNHIHTQNLRYNSYSPKPKYPMIGYLDYSTQEHPWQWLAHCCSSHAHVAQPFVGLPPLKAMTSLGLFFLVSVLCMFCSSQKKPIVLWHPNAEASLSCLKGWNWRLCLCGVLLRNLS